MLRKLAAVVGLMLIAGLLSACGGTASAATLAAPPAAQPVAAVAAPMIDPAPAAVTSPAAVQPAAVPMSIDEYVRAGFDAQLARPTPTPAPLIMPPPVGKLPTIDTSQIVVPQVPQPVDQPPVTPVPTDQTLDGTTGGDGNAAPQVTPPPVDQSQTDTSIYLQPGYMPPGYVPPAYVQPVYAPPIYQPVFQPSAYAPVYQPPAQPVAVDIPPVLGVHIVQPGESLPCIGAAYEVDPGAIMTANLLPPYGQVQPGDFLMIPATRWINMPAMTACPAQFDPNWSYFDVSAPAAPVCGNAVFGAPIMTASPFGTATDQQYVQAAGSYANGYGETFVITVTGRRYEAVSRFVYDLPAVCFGAARTRPAESVEAPGPAASLSITSSAGTGPVSVLADPYTYNLVIELGVSGVAGREYTTQSAFSFVIDPELYGGGIHYFHTPPNRDSALAVVGATGGSVSSTLYYNCAAQTPQTSLAGGWPAVLSGDTSGDYALTVSGLGGLNRYNVAGTWGNLDARAGGSVCR